ncbi:MAG: DUF2089 domain-containing protein [candidate division Zixibacteria bacterium]|nr:DUF2089 domain-containing protein [candidate division Zixibacteria bacterium]
MTQPWQNLTALTGSRKLVIERVRLLDEGTAIEGQFDLPPLAALTAEDQVFVAAFVRSHGSIKQMEAMFGVSYPTIKARLNRLSGLLDFVDIGEAPKSSEILERLDRGEMTVEEALEQIRKERNHG